MNDDGRGALRVGDVSVEWCDRFTCLGSICTSYGSVSSAIAAETQTQMCHRGKLISYVKKNRHTPFYVKRRVFDATLMSTVLHGCGSWFNGDLKPLVKLYVWGIKQLLGVLATTCNDLFYLELGLPPIRALVISR